MFNLFKKSPADLAGKSDEKKNEEISEKEVVKDTSREEQEAELKNKAFEAEEGISLTELKGQMDSLAEEAYNGRNTFEGLYNGLEKMINLWNKYGHREEADFIKNYLRGFATSKNFEGWSDENTEKLHKLFDQVLSGDDHYETTKKMIAQNLIDIKRQEEVIARMKREKELV
ncbi:MAG: hypothetical protein WC928_01130 [Patescibacteria group bacterium]|jgi:hypothetical protein